MSKEIKNNGLKSQAKPKKNKKVKFRHKHRFIYYFFWVCLVTFLTAVSFVFIYIFNVLQQTPKIDEDMLTSNQTSRMYDKDHHLIWEDTRSRRDYIKYKNIPDTYKDILLSVEDKDFYKNKGFSYKGIFNAGIGYAKEKMGGAQARGGSTLEQQLIKNVVFSSKQKDRNIDRKIKELMLAYQLDKNFSKKQILEWYVNKIEMGENTFGGKTAMMTYYGKDLKSMNEKNPDNIAKIATIVGLAQAPSTYNIYTNPKGTQMRRNNVLYAAYHNHKISKDQYQKATKTDIKKGLKKRFWRDQKISGKMKQHAAYIHSTLKQIEELGYDMQKTPLQIYTKLDAKKDNQLNKKIKNKKYFQDNKQQIAVTVLDNKKNGVIAQNGGRNLKDPYGINRATQHTRSSGSIIKPFLDYGPAIEYLGLSTNYRLNANNYTYPGTNIVAHNYGQWEYGNVDMKEALWQSYNTPAIRLLDQKIGSNRAKKFIAGLNMDTKKSYGGADALGLNVSTADLAGAFSSLANNGVYHKPSYINKIQFADDSTRKIVNKKKRVMKHSTSYILLKMMEGVAYQNKDAKSAKISKFKGHAIKTGSVAYDDHMQAYLPDFAAKDGWIGGTTKDMSVVLWTGYDSPNKPGHYLSKQNTNQRQTLYKDIMTELAQKGDTSDWKKPSTVSQSGTGIKADYSPLDTHEDDLSMPSPNQLQSTQINPFITHFDKNKGYKVKASKEGQQKAPKSFKEGKWKKHMSKKDKKIYERWQNDDQYGKDDLPDNIYVGDDS